MPLGLGLGVAHVATPLPSLDSHVGTGDYWVADDIAPSVDDGNEVTSWLGRRAQTDLEIVSSFGPELDASNTLFNNRACLSYVAANNDQLRIQNTGFYSSWTAASGYILSIASSSPEGHGSQLHAPGSATLVNDHQPFTDENVYSSFFWDTRIGTTGGPFTRDVVHLLHFTADSSLKIYVDNTLEATSGSGSFTNTINSSLAALSYIHVGNAYFDGQVAFVCLTDSVSATAHSAIIEFINSHYGLSL